MISLLIIACVGASAPLDKPGDSGDSSPPGDDSQRDTDTDTDVDTDTDTDTDTAPFPVDADGDGYTSDVDCDDHDADVNPGANDACWDGRDWNCDGVATGCLFEGDISLSNAGVKLLGTAESTEAGGWAWGGDLDGDAAADGLVMSVKGAGSTKSTLDVVLGMGAGVSSLAAAEASIVSDERDFFRHVSDPGDFDGDGDLDIVIGTGNVFVLTIPTAATVGTATADTTVAGGASESYGASSLWVGDLEGDGVQDLLVGAEMEAGKGACLFSGMPSGNVDVTAATGVIMGASHDASSVLGADLDGDGQGEVVVGSQGDDGDFADAGSIWLLTDYSGGVSDLSDADAHLTGAAAAEAAGAAMCTTDLDGDGYVDLIVGAPYNSETIYWAGVVYVWLGAPSGEKSLADSAAKLVGDEEQGWAGATLWCGDLDGDGSGEVLVGSKFYSTDPFPQAAAYRVSSVASGSTSLSTSTARFSEDQGDFSGYWLSATDVDGNGANDVLIGAPWEDTGGGNAGAAYIFYGPE